MFSFNGYTTCTLLLLMKKAKEHTHLACVQECAVEYISALLVSDSQIDTMKCSSVCQPNLLDAGFVQVLNSSRHWL